MKKSWKIFQYFSQMKYLFLFQKKNFFLPFYRWENVIKKLLENYLSMRFHKYSISHMCFKYQLNISFQLSTTGSYRTKWALEMWQCSQVKRATFRWYPQKCASCCMLVASFSTHITNIVLMHFNITSYHRENFIAVSTHNKTTICVHLRYSYRMQRTSIFPIQFNKYDVLSLYIFEYCSLISQADF